MKKLKKQEIVPTLEANFQAFLQKELGCRANVKVQIANLEITTLREAFKVLAAIYGVQFPANAVTEKQQLATICYLSEELGQELRPGAGPVTDDQMKKALDHMVDLEMIDKDQASKFMTVYQLKYEAKGRPETESAI